MANASPAKTLTVPASMKAWVLGNPDELKLVDKPVPQPGAAEVLVRIDAIAVCATDLEIIHSGPPALIQGGAPFNKNFTPGHEYMGTVVKLGPGVDEFDIGDRVTVEIHAGCGRCERCREGMYTACTNYGMNYGDRNKGHRANGFTTDGGFAQFAVNNINTMVHVPDDMSDEEATLVVTAGTAMYGLDVMGGLIAGQTVVVMGPGPDRADGCRRRESARRAAGDPDGHARQPAGDRPETRRGPRDQRAQRRCSRGRQAHHAWQGRALRARMLGRAHAVNEAARMLNRGGRICLAAFPHEPALVDVAYLVRNNIYLFGIRGEGKSATHRAAAFMAQKRFDAKLIHTHTFPLAEVPTAIKYARERIDDAIKVVVKVHQ
jgi:L-iditol 2-dehydrogenase